MVHRDAFLVSNVGDMRHGMKFVIAMDPVLVRLRSKQQQSFVIWLVSLILLCRAYVQSHVEKMFLSCTLSAL